MQTVARSVIVNKYNYTTKQKWVDETAVAIKKRYNSSPAICDIINTEAVNNTHIIRYSDFCTEQTAITILWLSTFWNVKYATTEIWHMNKASKN